MERLAFVEVSLLGERELVVRESEPVEPLVLQGFELVGRVLTAWLRSPLFVLTVLLTSGSMLTVTGLRPWLLTTLASVLSAISSRAAVSTSLR